MKSTLLATLALSTLIVSCGGDSEAKTPGESTATSSEAELVTDPEALPSDQEGLTQHYEVLLERLVTSLEGIDTEEQLEPTLDRIKGEIKPAFKALMDKSESLGISVETAGMSEKLDALVARMDVATKDLLQRFPTKAMSLMNTFSDIMGGVGDK